MADIDLTIKLAGEAGQGLQIMGQVLSKVFSRQGYFVFSNQAIQSRIRGGHNSFQIRISDRPILAPSYQTDVLVALDQDTPRCVKEFTKNSVVIFDAASVKVDAGRGMVLDIPLGKIASENGGNRMMANTAAVAAVLGLLECDIQVFFGLMRETFGEKDKEATNIKIAQAGYDFVYKKFPGNKLPRLNKAIGPAKMFVGGSEAVALGALAAGCQFISAYPMSPSTGIMTYLAGKESTGPIVVEQSEDECASINMALGASFAGARSMTASSGGGFALMVEGLSLAGMTETPIVIVVAQRPAPATGLPTRTAQEDLGFVIHAGHGEFPRFVVAVRTVEEAFYETVRAFNIAEKYRIPVLILTDQFIADSALTVEDFDLERIKIERHLLSEEKLRAIKNYQSYFLTRTGVSARALPGNPYCFVTADSDEHDETGRITEDLDSMRPRMVKKRNRKVRFLLKDVRPPQWHGPSHAKNILIGWGSTYGPLREAVDRLRREKEDVALAHFSDVWPLHEKHLAFISKAKRVVVVENNFTGQFCRLIAAATGRVMDNRINKFNGLPFDAQEIVREYKKLKKAKV